MRRVLVLYAGGTIGMERSPSGYRPMPGFAGWLRDILKREAPAHLPAFDVHALPQPIDSADLDPSDWTLMAEALIARWEDYDGFVVLHGTDTLAWSASALSFLLQGCDKPVIFTGAQIPWQEARSDAPANLQAALWLAAEGSVREVGLCFGRHLYRGNRSSKVASSDFDAFGSPNALPLADLGIRLHIHRERLLPSTPRAFTLPTFDPAAVAVLHIHPGLSARQIDHLLDDPAIHGVVLRSYGVGNAPTRDGRLLAALTRASQRGVLLLNTTQCPQGSVAQDTYATGARLAAAGVLPGGDLTLEAAFAKLHVLLATPMEQQARRTALLHPLCGEMTPAG